MDTNLEIVMERLGNILHNCSQSSAHHTKDEILDSLKRMLQDYNRNIGYEKVRIVDYRKGRA